ncbi:MAG: SH3 domain-containing protein [Treponemataceae bacterium]|nr:SH3 domain-containing protein [Treponemataceae bacterium]
MKKAIFLILILLYAVKLFSYDWKGKMEIFSYDLANRYKNEYFYVLEEYYETFKHRDRNYLTSVMPNFVNTGFWETAFDRYFEWYEIIRIKDLGIGIDKNKELLVFNGPLFVIENVEEITSELLKVETKILAYTRQSLKDDVLDWNFISDTSDDCTFYLEFDGDYINVYANDIDKKFCTFCKMYEEDIALLRECVKTNVWNDIKVTWPRHADGTCDYEDAKGNTASGENQGMESENAPAEAAILKPAPAVGKTATVTENLRLRTDDKTMAEVVATLAAGTRVKVLAPGREYTIDGITSNWVQVSVLGGANDKDGNAIEAGTKGWLFGGYLSETESTESEKANEEAADAKESSALPIVPIAAGGAALVILLAVVLLAAKRRKSS